MGFGERQRQRAAPGAAEHQAPLLDAQRPPDRVAVRDQRRGAVLDQRRPPVVGGVRGRAPAAALVEADDAVDLMQ